MATGGSRRWAIGVALLAFVAAAPARAFDLKGHDVIEAAAYKRLLAMPRVPGTGVSGRELMGALIAGRVLAEPPCFDGHRLHDGCGGDARLRTPLAFWPVLGAGAADLIINRQLNADAQCQHFMAETRDGLTPPDPRTGIPSGLESTAYRRCIRTLGLAFDAILRDPSLARARLIGLYALIHAVEDSFSAAHTARDEHWRIHHLLSWTLLDWPVYFRRGSARFPPLTHHAVTDRRDADYLRWDAVSDEGRPCSDYLNPYAVPASCLTPRAQAAADAVLDLVVLTYRLRKRASAAGRSPSITTSDEDRADWERYVAAHLASASEPFEAPPFESSIGPKATDSFLGVRGVVMRDGGWGAGVWGSRMFLAPAVPFALLISGGAGYARDGGSNSLDAALSLGLVLPLIRRFAIGFAPIGLMGSCSTSFDRCGASLSATTGVLILPLPHSLWLTLEGPRWSWEERAFEGAVFAVALGRSKELDRHEPALPNDVPPTWQPPSPDEVLSYRRTLMTWSVWFAATAASTQENRWIAGGADVRWDRDRWNRRAGLVPLISAAVEHGVLGGTDGTAAKLAPALGAYLVPDRLAVVATPASLRVGTLYGRTWGVDVAGVLSLALDVARVELAVDSPPLSYVSGARWHWLPFALRLGLLID